jgi:hypothetical protein
MKTIRSLVMVAAMVMVMVAFAGPMGRAHAAEKSGSKSSTPVMGQSMEKTTAKPAAKFKAEPAAKTKTKPAAKTTAKPADKNAVKKERKQKAEGDTRVKNGKNAGGRGKAA